MEEQNTVVTCGQCGTVLDEPSSTLIEKREPCPDCGSTGRHVGKGITAEVPVQSGVRGKARSGVAGQPGGKPWLNLMSEPSWSYDRQKWMDREQTENRRDHRYTEVVKD